MSSLSPRFFIPGSKCSPALKTALLVAGLWSGCEQDGSPAEDDVLVVAADGGSGGDAVAAEHAATHEATSDYVVDQNDIVTITLSDSGIELSENAGERLSASASRVTVVAPGAYRLVGALSDGQVIVNSATEGTVQLVLAGIDVTAASTAPLAILAATKAVIMLEDGSDNRLADTVSHDATSDVNATLFSLVDLSIYGGSGTLHVRGSSNDAIASKAGLVIEGANVYVDAAADDGIRGKDYLVLRESSVEISAVGDGLKSDEESDASRGYIEIVGGTFKLAVGADAIQAQTDLTIYDGTFQITSGGGSGAALAADASAKGLKAGALLAVYGGTFDLDVADDALHSNDTLLIEDGSFTVRAGDDALHSELDLTINGGVFDITRSVEGIESATITLNGGKLHVVASDDGVNVADGEDAHGQVIAANQLRINGGYLDVSSDGDGIDANGSITMQGGTVIVTGPTAQNNAPLDYDRTFEIKGGLLIAAGSAGMAQAPSASSSQPSLKVTYGTSSSGVMAGGRPGAGSSSTATLPAGTLIRILKSDGVELLSFSPSKPWQSVVFSSDQLSLGSSGEIYTGGSCTGGETDGLHTNATCTDGTLRSTFTVSSSVTNVSFQ